MIKQYTFFRSFWRPKLKPEIEMQGGGLAETCIEKDAKAKQKSELWTSIFYFVDSFREVIRPPPRPPVQCQRSFAQCR